MAFRRKKRGEVRIEITPMVDVVFLLLIFFMISTSFVDISAIGINLPKASSTQIDTENSELKVYLDKNGRVYLNEQEVNKEEVENLITQHAQTAAQTHFKLYADEEVKHGRVIEFIDLARQQGFATLSIATRHAGAKSVTTE